MFLRATFAYFTASVQNGTGSSVIVKTAEIGTITFNDGTEINLKDALPGASQQKTFTITSDTTSTSGVKYGIKFAIDSNDFDTDLGDLVYSLKGTPSGATSTSGQTVATVNEGAIEQASGSIDLGNGTLMPGETHNYTFIIRFKETGSDQNSNQGKTFKGHLEVTTGDKDGSTLYYNNENSTGTSEMPTSQSSEDFPTE